MDEKSLTLHFGLEEGQNADLEVVASAAVKWVEVMRAAAREIDPDATFRVELVDVQTGSLKFNGILDWLEDQISQLDDGAGRHWRVKKLAIALAVFAVVSGGPTYNYYFGENPQTQLSREDRVRIDSLIEALNGNPEFEEKKREFYQELERDSSISEVGVSEGRDMPPAIRVPRNRFSEGGGLWAIERDTPRRTTYEVLDVTLVRPTLMPAKRAWTFSAEGRGEFSATMRDEAFLQALEHDHVQERLRVGIQMQIRLRIDEEQVNGEWRIKHGGRSVVQVLEPQVNQ